MFERILAILIKEFIEIFRDPRTRAIIFMVPIIQTLLFGYAVTMDVKHVATAVYDLDNSVQSRRVIDAFVQSGYFYITSYLHKDQHLQDVINSGKAILVLHFNKGFESDIQSGKSAPLQIILDGTDSNTASVVFGYASQIVQRISEKIIVERVGEATNTNEVQLESRAWFNSNLESRNFYVPGVMAILITLMTLTLTSMAIVREKEMGTIEQIIVSPITKGEFILGKTIPFILIGFVEVVLILLVAIYWFEVPLRGNLFVLLFACSLYLLTTLGIGLFISTISQTQQQAMMSVLLFYLPAVLLSGFIFPVANMPQVIQWITMINPLKYFLIVIRGVFLKGIGLSILWPQLLLLGVMGIFILWLATKRFHKTMA